MAYTREELEIKIEKTKKNPMLTDGQRVSLLEKYNKDIESLPKETPKTEPKAEKKELKAKAQKELNHLKKVIAYPRTGEEEKKRFQSIVDRIEGKYKTTETAEPVSEPMTVNAKRSHHKKKDVSEWKENGDAESNIKSIPDCDELVKGFKAKKKAMLERKFKKEKDHRAPDTKLRDDADKKITAIINNLKKLSIKNKVSGKVRKDILTILKQGIKHASK